LVQDLEGHLASFAAEAHRALLRLESFGLDRPRSLTLPLEGGGMGGGDSFFIKLAISIAATPASYPRFTPLLHPPAPGAFPPTRPEPCWPGFSPVWRAPSRTIPDRASASCPVAVVKPPKWTRTPASLDVVAIPLAT